MLTIIIDKGNVSVKENLDKLDYRKLWEFLLLINSKLDKIMEDLSKLQQAVANATTVEQSAITLIQGLADQIKNLPVGDQGAIDALAASVQSGADALAAAVSANTPAATAPAAPAAPAADAATGQ